MVSGAVLPVLTIWLSFPVKHKLCILPPQKVTPSTLKIPAIPSGLATFSLSLLQLVAGFSRTQPRCSASQEAYPDNPSLSILDTPSSLTPDSSLISVLSLLHNPVHLPTSLRASESQAVDPAVNTHSRHVGGHVLMERERGKSFRFPSLHSKCIFN